MLLRGHAAGGDAVCTTSDGARRAGLGPAGLSYAQTGSAAGGFSPAHQKFRYTDRHFHGQSDIGAALVPGSASYDAGTRQYTIHSAGYNIWYSRDEFRYLWKKMSGDVSLAADVTFPDPTATATARRSWSFARTSRTTRRKSWSAEHGAGMIHLAQRPDKARTYQGHAISLRGHARQGHGEAHRNRKARRLHRDLHQLKGEPMHQFGPPITLHFNKPFYAGIGFCSHLPDKSDTAVLSDVVLENSAAKVHQSAPKGEKQM